MSIVRETLLNKDGGMNYDAVVQYIVENRPPHLITIFDDPDNPEDLIMLYDGLRPKHLAEAIWLIKYAQRQHGLI